MATIYLALGLMLAAGVLALPIAWVRPAAGRLLSVLGGIAGGCLGLAGLLAAPLGLREFFLVPLFVLGLFGSVWIPSAGRGCLHHLMWSSLAVAFLADHLLLFIAAWQTAALVGYFLISPTTESEREPAGWLHLASTHLATLVLTATTAATTGGLDFDFSRLARMLADDALTTTEPTRHLVLIGLGLGAALMTATVPLHVRIPATMRFLPLVAWGAPLAGFFALLRALAMLETPPLWFAHAMITLGLLSAFFGPLWAIVQRDAYRLVAYLLVGHLGLVTAALGLGLLAKGLGLDAISALASSGALLHLWNVVLLTVAWHGVLRAVNLATGTSDLARLGGLQARLPWTCAAALVAAIGLAGLPPLNTWASQYVIGVAAARAVNLTSLSATDAVAHLAVTLPAVAVVVGMTLAVGLMCVAALKLVGLMIVGAPRSEQAANAAEVSVAMRGWILLPALACLTAAVVAPEVVSWVTPAINPAVNGSALLPMPTSGGIVMAGAFAVFGLGLAALRVTLIRTAIRATPPAPSVWDGGHAGPVYATVTPSHIAQPFAAMFNPLAGPLPSEPDRDDDSVDPVARWVTGRWARLSRAWGLGRGATAWSARLWLALTVLWLLILLVWMLA